MADQDEDLITDDEDLRARARQAAEQGADQLGEVVGGAIEELAEQFTAKMESLLSERGAPDTTAAAPPRQFVTGALFGAFVFAVGVLLGRRH